MWELDEIYISMPFNKTLLDTNLFIHSHTFCGCFNCWVEYCNRTRMPKSKMLTLDSKSIWGKFCPFSSLPYPHFSLLLGFKEFNTNGMCWWSNQVWPLTGFSDFEFSFQVWFFWFVLLVEDKAQLGRYLKSISLSLCCWWYCCDVWDSRHLVCCWHTLLDMLYTGVCVACQERHS